MPTVMSPVCSNSFGAGIALPGPRVYTAENSPLNFSLGLNHQPCCSLNPPNLRHSLEKKKKKKETHEKAQMTVFTSCWEKECLWSLSWPGHSLQDDLWIYRPSGSMFFALEGPISCYSDLGKGWDTSCLTGELGRNGNSSAGVVLSNEKMRKLLKWEELAPDLGSLKKVFYCIMHKNSFGSSSYNTSIYTQRERYFCMWTHIKQFLGKIFAMQWKL